MVLTFIHELYLPLLAPLVLGCLEAGDLFRFCRAQASHGGEPLAPAFKHSFR